MLSTFSPSILAFEVRYHLRRPTFWLITGLFFTIGLVDIVSKAEQGNAFFFVNSPSQIFQTRLWYSIFGLLAASAFVAETFVRDANYQMDSLILSTPIRKWDYLATRFIEGNARLIPLSNQLLGAHIAHAGLIMFWAGSITISQALNYDPSYPLEEQGLALVSNIARLGWGLNESGQLETLYPAFVIGMLHLVASAVLGAGGLFHVFGGPKRLADANGWAKKFHYEWDDPKQLTLILGHHLLFLGVAALAFVAKATRWNGIYDPAVGQVRLIKPNLNPADIFGYLVGLTPDGWSAWGIASVNNLEDVIGGHAWIGAMLIFGGIFHILVDAKIIVPIRLNADAILSYSLGAVSFMAFVS